MDNIFGERLGSALLELGWSQAELAASTGLDPAHISRYITGKVRPRNGNFRRILDALDMSEREFMRRDELSPAAAGRAELRVQLRCEVEVLLELTRRMLDALGGEERSAGSLDPEQAVMRATIEAMTSKVALIQGLVGEQRAG